MARRRGGPGTLAVGSTLAALLGLAALLAPWIAPHPPERLDLGTTLAAPSSSHWMGTDALGRDVTSRVLHGARVSLTVGLLATALTLLVGVPLGALAGYCGGTVDAVVSRVIESVMCFPGLVLVLVLLAASPSALLELPDVVRLAVVLGATGWTVAARYLRGEFARLRSLDMVLAARAAGIGHLRIAVRHILPCSLAPLLVATAFSVGAAIALEAALSFLGLGVRPPTASWGGMLNEAREQVDRAWWLALFPGAAVFLTVLTCNLLTEGVRDRLDPHRRAP